MMALNTSNYWVIAGIAMVIGEMLTGSFFLIFIALGAFAASLIATFSLPEWMQLATCAVVSIAGVTALRKTLQLKFLKKTMEVKADVGREIQTDQAISPHQRARIRYQGTSWEATNVGSEAVKAGDRIMIVGMDGNSLLVRKVN